MAVFWCKLQDEEYLNYTFEKPERLKQIIFDSMD